MPDVRASIEYLQNLPLYGTEKPFHALRGPEEGYDPDAQRLDNLEFEVHDNILVKDMRNRINDFTLEKHGFEVLSRQMANADFDTLDDIESCKRETETVLRGKLGAEYVKCYEVRIRKNKHDTRSHLVDLNDPLLIDGPAKGAHSGLYAFQYVSPQPAMKISGMIDVTLRSGPAIIQRYLDQTEKETYLKPGYRFRIINTWRPLIPRLEDRPLALCDSRSVDTSDLMAADLVYPDRVGEVYYLTYNKTHQWYWLEKQQPSESFVFIMYDTKNGEHARFCPHVSFDNPRKSPIAELRHSIETRSIIISRDRD